MVIDPIAENFYWVENNKRFPLARIRHADDFSGLEQNLSDIDLQKKNWKKWRSWAGQNGGNVTS